MFRWQEISGGWKIYYMKIPRFYKYLKIFQLESFPQEVRPASCDARAEQEESCGVQGRAHLLLDLLFYSERKFNTIVKCKLKT